MEVFNLNIIKKFSLVFLIILILVIISSTLVRYLNKYVGVTYGTTSLNQCLNDKRIKYYDNILLGTSVSRELTLSTNDFIYKNNNYYNCGLSAPTTNLTFHYLLLNILGSKIDLKGKKIFLEISQQTLLKEEPILFEKSFKSFIDFLPLESKIFMIKDYVQYSYSKKSLKHLNNVFLLFKSLIFPIDSLRFITNTPTYNERKNVYLNKVSNENSLDENELKLFYNKFNPFFFNYRMNEIKKLADYYGVEIKFLLVPSNEIYASHISNNTLNSINSYINDKIIMNSLDFRFLDKNEYFADCCHYNSNGQKTILNYIKDMDDNKK